MESLSHREWRVFNIVKVAAVVLILAAAGWRLWLVAARRFEARRSPTVAVGPLLIEPAQFSTVGNYPTIRARLTARGARATLRVVDWNGLILGTAELVASATSTETAAVRPYLSYAAAPLGWIEIEESGRQKSRSQIAFAAASSSVRLYWVNQRLSAGTVVCEKVWPVERAVLEPAERARAALEELVRGPTAEEARAGYTSALPAGIAVNSVAVLTDTARVDFSAPLPNRSSDRCAAVAARRQIEATLQAASGARRVIITAAGKSDSGQ